MVNSSDVGPMSRFCRHVGSSRCSYRHVEPWLRRTMGWVPRFFCCCRSQVFANYFFSQVFTNSPFSQVFTSSPLSLVLTSSPFSQEAPSPVEHTPSAISTETLWTQSTALAPSSSSLQQQANTATSTTSNQTQPTPHTHLNSPPPPPQRSGGDVLVWPTNWDCDRWLTLTMLQFHPVVLAMTADGILRIVCMRLCGEPIRVLTTLPPPPPTHTHTDTHTHTHSPPHTRQCCRVVSTCATRHTYTYFFSGTLSCSTCVLCICIPFFSPAVHRPVLHVIHMHTFFSHMSTCSTCCTYAYLYSRTPTCSTRHTHAYLFQPPAEVKEGVAGLCERCVRCSYPQVFTVQQHVQMSVCVHPHPDTTARSDIL